MKSISLLIIKIAKYSLKMANYGAKYAKKGLISLYLGQITLFLRCFQLFVGHIPGARELYVGAIRGQGKGVMTPQMAGFAFFLKVLQICIIK